MGDRYELCSNMYLATRLRNTLRRSRLVETTGQKGNVEAKVEKNSDTDEIDVDEAAEDEDFSVEEQLAAGR